MTGDVERCLTEGQRLLRQGRWEEAEQALEQAAKGAPEHRWPHLYLALARADAGRPEEALPEIDRALELSPPSPVLRVFRARILCDAGRGVDALDDLRQAIALDARYTVARGYQALALLEQGDVAAAWEQWQSAPAEPPSALLGRMLLAAEGLERPHPEPTEEPVDLPEVPDGKPGARHRPAPAAVSALKRARRLYFKERLVESHQSYRAAVRADPRLGEAWLEFAVTCYELAAYEAAKQALARYLQVEGLDESDPHYRAYQAGCEARLGNPESALELLEGADATQPVVPFTRGVAMLALDRIPEARHAFIQFAAMTPRLAQSRIQAILRDREPVTSDREPVTSDQ